MVDVNNSKGDTINEASMTVVQFSCKYDYDFRFYLDTIMW